MVIFHIICRCSISDMLEPEHRGSFLFSSSISELRLAVILCWIIPVRRYASRQLWILKVQWVRMGTVAPVHPTTWLVGHGCRNRTSLRLHQAAAPNHWEPDRRSDHRICVAEGAQFTLSSSSCSSAGCRGTTLLRSLT